jgi:hypothetical protein
LKQLEHRRTNNRHDKQTKNTKNAVETLQIFHEPRDSWNLYSGEKLSLQTALLAI